MSTIELLNLIWKASQLTSDQRVAVMADFRSQGGKDPVGVLCLLWLAEDLTRNNNAGAIRGTIEPAAYR